MPKKSTKKTKGEKVMKEPIPGEQMPAGGTEKEIASGKEKSAETENKMPIGSMEELSAFSGEMPAGGMDEPSATSGKMQMGGMDELLQLQQKCQRVVWSRTNLTIIVFDQTTYLQMPLHPPYLSQVLWK